MNDTRLSSELRFTDLNDTRIAYRREGNGPALLLLHGWPLTGQTFRHLVPAFRRSHTCYVVDLPGAGESQWSERTDLSFNGQAESVRQFAATLRLDSYAVVAHDTGATIARQLALIDAPHLRKLVAIGTEIPHHRPAGIPQLQKTSRLPGSDLLLQAGLKSRGFLHSSRGFGGCFHDPALIDGEFHSLFVAPLVESKTLRQGQMQRLRGIDWALLDGLATQHARIEAEVLLVWGEDDPVFPVSLAREMVPQFKRCRGLVAVPQARLFVHEEKPAEVARICLDFLVD